MKKKGAGKEIEGAEKREDSGQQEKEMKAEI